MRKARGNGDSGAKLRRESVEDDGRTIADMSAVESPNLFRIRRPGSAQSSFSEQGQPKRQTPEEAAGTKEEAAGTKEERPWEQPELMTPQERRMYVLGALKAALLIGLAFIVGLGLVILFLFRIWT